jgi:hypothetical protein
VGEKFGVSDNAVRKWCKKYGLPCKKNEIKKMREELGITEWNAKVVEKDMTLIAPGKAVEKYTLSGEFVSKYRTMGEAAREINKEGKSKGTISSIQTNISRCCQKKIKQAYGYVWNFI